MMAGVENNSCVERKKLSEICQAAGWPSSARPDSGAESRSRPQPSAQKNRMSCRGEQNTAFVHQYEK